MPRTDAGATSHYGSWPAADAQHGQNFQLSVLQVFSLTPPSAQADAAEDRFKRALLTRQFGMNLN